MLLMWITYHLHEKKTITSDYGRKIAEWGRERHGIQIQLVGAGAKEQGFKGVFALPALKVWISLDGKRMDTEWEWIIGCMDE